MARKGTADLKHGKEVWKCLERAAYTRSENRIFADWLDLCLSAVLSLTDNLVRDPKGFTDKLMNNKLDGEYEERYRSIAAQYGEGKQGERPIDYMTQAWHLLKEETEREKKDVLGGLYMARITLGEKGQFFTPQHVARMMAEVVEPKDGESVSDPACGSGTMLIEAGLKNPNLRLYGKDLDERCAKMCALNMWILGFNAVIEWGNTLTMQTYKYWSMDKSGFIVEREPEVVAQAA